MDRYIGLDAHSSSCTVAVIGPSGRQLQSQVLETNAIALGKAWERRIRHERVKPLEGVQLV